MALKHAVDRHCTENIWAARVDAVQQNRSVSATDSVHQSDGCFVDWGGAARPRLLISSVITCGRGFHALN